jgi:hypothetical protein
VWTPRRVGLLLVGVVCVAAAFAVYQFFFGVYDGLPAVPAKYLVAGKSAAPVYPVSSTLRQLQMAFGDGSPEGSSDVRVYKHRLPIADRNGVMAIGNPQTDGTPRVVVAPVSVALFGPRNARVRAGEQVEITTLHADRAVITFDKPIARIDDMGTAKVAQLDLESEPDDDPRALADTRRDPRQGRIWVTNNRKSPDPADHLVLRTPGPLLVQLPADDAPESPDTKHIWTAASVEVFDRRNLPRKLRAREVELAKLNTPDAARSAVEELLRPEPIPPVAAAVQVDDPREYNENLRRYTDDLRRFNAVADILSGRTLPPPTAVGRGLAVRLAPAKKDPNAPKRGQSFSGVRDMVLGEGVLMCLWVDGNSGFPGSRPTPATPTPTNSRPLSPYADPPLGSLAVGGGLIDGGTLAERFDTRSLLVVTTPGAFQYDLDKSLATFDAAAIAPDGGQNFVVVTRLNARNQTDDLICTKLELDLSDPDKDKPNAPRRANPAVDGGGVVLRQITATGPLVQLSAQAEGLEASCVKLVHTQDAARKQSVTTLYGTTEVPVVAVQRGNKLTAGDALTAAVVTLTTKDAPAEIPTGGRWTTLGVVGPGRMELVDRDPDTGALKSSVAQWAKKLDHEKWPKGGRAVDLFKFHENAAFVDAASNFSLRAADIWLWVANKPAQPGEPGAREITPVSASSAPEQLVATADVHLDSTDLVVRKTNKLTVWFSDIAAPKPMAQPAPMPVPVELNPMPMAVGPMPPAALPTVVVAAEPPKPMAPAEPPKEPIPNPIQLQADTVEAWMGRYPEVIPPPADKPAPAKPPQPKTKYELLKARCDDNVQVHQDPDPNDPAKPANGLDITSNKLILENTPGGGGSVLTVTGGKGPDGWSMVAFEDTVIYGPEVVIDQPNNTASVKGRGRLRSLTSTDVAGNDLSSPSDLVVDWTERMRFEGAKAFALFVGGVVVQQEAKGDKPRAAAAQPQPDIVPAARLEQLPQPRDAGPVNTATGLSHLWCHQLDLTLDRPVYFNQLRKNDRNKANREPGEPRPKVKAAVATPHPDPDPKQPGERYVIFREQSVAPSGEVLKARMLTARQMDFANKSKEQELYATGPGELRLLQQAKAADDNRGAAARPAAKPEMKLTVVTFQKTMTAVDQGNGLFQKATFEKGGVVTRTPTTDLMLTVEPHALPAGSEYLRSEDELIVSSAKAKKESEPDQRLTALGNAEFRDDRRTGLGDKIVFDGTRVTLDASRLGMASLYSNRRAVNQQQMMKAKKFIYNSATGVVELNDTTGGTILPGK